LLDAFLDGLGGALDEVLGFLEAEARDRADLLDHLDLLLARAGQDHVELGLLLDRGCRCTPTGAGHGHRRGRRGHAPLRFHALEQLRDVHVLEVVDLTEDLVDAGHEASLPVRIKAEAGTGSLVSEENYWASSFCWRCSSALRTCPRSAYSVP